MTLLGFEIVAYAGDARSKLLEALKAAENGDFAKADSCLLYTSPSPRDRG